MDGGPQPGPVPDGRGGPHVFVADLDRPELDDDDRHHLARVLRLRPGDPLTVCDGAGGWRAARFGAVVEPCGPVVAVPRAEPAVTVAFAPVKGDRPEWVVQKLTEVGVDRIIGFTAERSVVRPDGERSERTVGRWRRVAREAAMQSRRCHLPAVEGVWAFADVVALGGVSLADAGGGPPSLAAPVVAVGPEGGWAERELACGAPRVRVAANVVRAETAAVAAGVLLCALRAGLCRPGPVGSRSVT